MSNDMERTLNTAIREVDRHWEVETGISASSCSLIIEILKKQIPLNPINICFDQDGRGFGKCPICGCRVTSALNHCMADSCLQRLSWRRK